MTTATDAPPEVTYTAEQITHLTGATYRQIDFWCRTDRLTPFVEAKGSGSHRRFNTADLDTVRLVVALLRAGFTLPAAFRIAERLVAHDEYRVVLADVFELRIGVRDTNGATG